MTKEKKFKIDRSIELYSYLRYKQKERKKKNNKKKLNEKFIINITK